MAWELGRKSYNFTKNLILLRCHGSPVNLGSHSINHLMVDQTGVSCPFPMNATPTQLQGLTLPAPGPVKKDALCPHPQQKLPKEHSHWPSRGWLQKLSEFQVCYQKETHDKVLADKLKMTANIIPMSSNRQSHSGINTRICL